MLFCLMQEIGETPPADFLENAKIKAEQLKIEREKQSALQTFKTEKGKVRRRDGDRSR